MSDLHPRARALIDAAKRGETPLPWHTRARVHRSVLRRAIALGAAVATTSTVSAASKAAARMATWVSPIGVPAVFGALAVCTLLVLRTATTPAEPPGSVPPVASHALVRDAPTEVPIVPATGGPSALPVSPTSIVAPPPGPSEMGLIAPVPVHVSPVHVSPVPTPLAMPVPMPAATPLRTFSAERSPDTRIGTTSATPLAVRFFESSTERSGPRGERAEPSATAPTTATPAATTTPASGVGAANVAPLAEDLERLRGVRANLRTGHPELVLSLLDREGGRLEAGPLAEEAQAARVSALCQLGRQAEVHEATRRFLAVWPASPLAMRLRLGCAALGADSTSH
ncbi:MAG: hypothetical protein ABSC94_31150 [Polyangiaceae bacterium]